MVNIPNQWGQITINDNRCLIGLNIDEVQLQYQLYVIDLVGFKVWFEQKTKSQILTVLNSKGFLDLEDEKLKLFLNRLQDLIHKDAPSVVSDNNVSITVQDNTISWEFTPMDGHENTNEIYSKFILKQLSVINAFDNQMENLLHTIHERDNYMKYLKENYRLINGEALLKKYHKINPNPEVSQEFDVKAWLTNFSKSYKEPTQAQNIETFVKLSKANTQEESLVKQNRTDVVKIDEIPIIKLEESVKSNTSPKRQKRGIFKSKKKS